MTWRSFSVLSCTLWLACGNIDESNTPAGDTMLAGKADGFQFIRGLTPLDVKVNQGTHVTNFNPYHYIAYRFEMPETGRVTIAHNVGFWTAVWQGSKAYFGHSDSYRANIMLFRLNEEKKEPQANPMELWDLIAESELTEYTTILEYSIEQKGTFMALVLGTPSCYEDKIESLTDIVADSPGGADGRRALLRVAVTTDQNVPAKNILVSLGGVQAMTGDDGVAVLEGTETGKLIAKFGPLGLGRASLPSGPVRVWGDDEWQWLVFVISDWDYEYWAAGYTSD
jgi:hypothetical protein